MSSVNKVILIGTLGRDPEMRATQDGKQIATLNVATSERWKDRSGERKEKTEWHKVVIFNENLVKVVSNYARKGSKLYIEGSLQTRKWQNKDGVDQYSTEIVLQNYNGNITLLNKVDADEQSLHDTAKSNGYQPQNDLDDSIPW